MRMKGRWPELRTVLFALLGGALASACAASGQGTNSGEPPISSEVIGSQDDERVGPSPFHEALSAARQSTGDLESLRMFAKCLGDGGRYEKVEIFGDGLVIWNGESQIRIPRLAVIAFLNLVHESGFATMPATVGSKAPERSPPDPGNASVPLRILCEVEVEIGDQKKRVEQHNKGDRSAALETLANNLLDACRRRGQLGTLANDLADGLAKVSERTLAPETFRLLFQEKPELSQDDEAGLLLDLRGHALMAREQSRSSGYSPSVEIELTDTQFGNLVRQLAVRNVADMPINLYADNYVDLTIEVLNHRKSIQARRFAGIDTNTHGETQRDFEKLLKVVRELWQTSPRKSAQSSPDNQTLEP